MTNTTAKSSSDTRSTSRPAGRWLIVLVHGYGADGADISPLGGYLTSAIPGGAQVYAPDAPEPCAGAPFGRQWFAIPSMAPETLHAGCEAALPGFAALVRDAQQQYGAPPERTILVGFSQGAMLALTAALAVPGLAQTVLGFSGGCFIPDAQVRADPGSLDVLLVHGAADPVVAPEASRHTAERLESLGVRHALHMIPGAAHEITGEGVSKAQAFLRARCA